MAKNNKTRFFYVLYSDKTRVFDQSERAYYPIYIIKLVVFRFAGSSRNSSSCGNSRMLPLGSEAEVFSLPGPKQHDFESAGLYGSK